MWHGQVMKGKFKNIVFVCPDPKSFISGGNIYNLHFLEALRKYDPAVQQIDFETFLKLNEKQNLYFFDTIYFDQLKKYKGDLSSAYLIFHHVESLNQAEENRVEYFRKEEQELLDRFGGFLSTSHYSQSYLMTLGYVDVNHLVLPPAINFKPKRRQKDTDKINAVMVNNLMQRKGIIEFLSALKKSKITKEQFQLTIIGGDTLEPEYAQACKVLLRDRKLQDLVSYIGPLPHAKVKRYFEESNLYISSAFMETFGIALQEAVAYRIPVLAYDGGSANYHIEEFENGFLFDTHEELVFTLEELCFRPDEFKRLVDSAWKFREFESYTWEEVIGDFVRQMSNSM